MAEDFLAGLEGGLETGIMAGVATGNPIVGAVAGGLGLITSMFQSRQQRQTGKQLAGANRQAAQYQFAASMKSLDMWNGYLSQMTRQFKPWRVAGMAAMDQMMQGMGVVVPEGTFDIGPDWDTGVSSGDIQKMAGAIIAAQGGGNGGGGGGDTPKLPLVANVPDLMKKTGVDLPLVANVRKLFKW